MEIVTLAYVTLNRVGSASSPGMARHNEVTRVREVPNGSTETLLELVKTVAQENGESRERLHALQHERNATRHSIGQKGAVVFDIQGPTTWHQGNRIWPLEIKLGSDTTVRSIQTRRKPPKILFQLPLDGSENPNAIALYVA